VKINLSPELKDFIEHRIRSDWYENATDVIRAGLRALEREEIRSSKEQFQRVIEALPTDPITPEIEQEIEATIYRARERGRRRSRKRVRW